MARTHVWNACLCEEMEQQSAIETLGAGDELTWRVKWYLREFPADADATAGDALLLDFTENIATGNPGSTF